MRWQRLSCLVLGVLSTMLWSGEALGEKLPSWASDGQLRDAQAYSQLYGVGIDEALSRLELQLAVGDLAAELEAEEADVFAGVWIEHQPGFRVMVAFTDALARDWIHAYTAGTALADRVEVRHARYSLAQLRAVQGVADRALRSAGQRVDSEISVPRNEVDLMVVDVPRSRQATLEALSRLSGPISVWPVEALSRPDVDLHGGLSTSSCTTGFSVIEEDELPGVTIAGHCSNSQSYGSIALPFQQQLFSGSHDIQWHTSGCQRVTNRIKDGGSSTRAITGRRVRNQQTVGMFVCKYGRTTGLTCGEIASTTFEPGYVPNVNDTFVRVNAVVHGVIAAGGDSGGPWFAGNRAFGTHSGSSVIGPEFAVYMPIDFVDDLDVDLVTRGSRTPRRVSVSVSCSGAFWGSTQITCTANAGGGYPPYDFQWTYSGSAQGWDTSGNPVSAYFWSPGCPAGSTNYFTVTVTDRTCQRVVSSGPNVCL